MLLLHKTGIFTQFLIAHTTELFISRKNPFMAVLTLQQIFGTSATQDATTLTIHKADLAIVGAMTPFIPATTNTADSLLAALIAFAETNASNATAQTDPTQTVGIDDGYKSIVTVNSIDYLLLPKTINFYSTFSGNFNPNNY